MTTNNFKSYLADVDSPSSTRTASTISVDVDALDGEIVSVACENVLRFDLTDLAGKKTGSGSGELGLLSCSQFRMIFTPLLPKPSVSCSRSLVFDDALDIPWKLVDQILYTTVDDAKFHPMSGGLSFNERPSKLRFELKDFRVIKFDFSTSSGMVSSKDIANYAYQFSFPSSLACYTCPKSLKQPRNRTRSCSFINQKDWFGELERTGAKMRGWRVSDFNYEIKNVPSYPKYSVVPGRLTEAQLNYACTHFNLNRLPVWCWSSVEYGCFIMRSAELSVEESSEYPMFLKSVSELHPKRVYPIIIDVNMDIPSVRKSYQALKNICVEADSSNQFDEMDKYWLRRLNDTEWLFYVLKCLSWARKVVDHLANDHISVIIQEAENRDISCVVSSLAQLCLDPYFRTIEGFYTLVQKEWIAMGHPFGLRIFGLDKVDYQQKEMAPIFLLFLDCVFQLLSMYPLRFEFTEHFLIAMHDCCLSGVAEVFLINQFSDLYLNADMEQISSTANPWPLSNYFNRDFCATFVNPAYHLNNVYCNADPYRTYLSPPRTMHDIQFWETHYLRWNVLAFDGPEYCRMDDSNKKVITRAGGNINKLATLAGICKDDLARKILYEGGVVSLASEKLEQAMMSLPQPNRILSPDYPYLYLDRIERKKQMEMLSKSKNRERNWSSVSGVSVVPVNELALDRGVGLHDNSDTASSSTFVARSNSFLPALREKLNDLSLNRSNSMRTAAPNSEASISTQV